MHFSYGTAHVKLDTHMQVLASFLRQLASWMQLHERAFKELMTRDARESLRTLHTRHEFGKHRFLRL